MAIKPQKSIRIKNKRASFEFELLDVYDCGIILTGTEIKSLREGKASLVDAFAYIHNREIWLKEAYIAEYANGGHFNHLPKRNRKLLLQKKEILKIEQKLNNVGFTLVPTVMYINAKGLAKVRIAIAKGKKNYDKRNSLKEKDIKRQIDRAKLRY